MVSAIIRATKPADARPLDRPRRASATAPSPMPAAAAGRAAADPLARSRRVACVCDARGVDGVLLIAIIGLAVALVAAMMLVRRRTDELESLRRDSGDRLAALAATEATRTAAAKAQAIEAVEAMLPVGVLHLDRDRRIDRANERAHALLEVRPGRLIGRSVMEAFLDPRAEGLIDGVPVGGTGSGEVKVGDREPHRPRRQRPPARRHRPPRRPRGRHRAAPPPADPVGVHRQPQPRAAHAAEHRQPPGRDARPRRGGQRGPGADAGADHRRSRSRPGHLVQMVNELLDLARIEGGSQLVLARRRRPRRPGGGLGGAAPPVRRSQRGDPGRRDRARGAD